MNLLPIEIIQLIGNVDGQSRDCLNQKSLRLVCSQFNRAFEAQVLSTLVIALTNNTLKQSLDMLCMFALQNRRTSRAVQHARILKIKYLSPTTRFPISEHDEPESQDPSPSSPSLLLRLASGISSLMPSFKRKLMSKDITSAMGEEFMERYLELAISSMKNLETVGWAVHAHDPSWTEAAVIRGITRLPQLQDLQLTLYRNGLFESSIGNMQFDRLSGLKKISLSGYYGDRPRDIIGGLAKLIAICPRLVHLKVNLGHHDTMMSPETLTLHDLLNKVPEDHQLQLTHLALNSMGIRIDPSTLPHIRSLISLDLMNLPAPSNLTDDADHSSERMEMASSTSDICEILKQEGIYLKHVVVSDAEGVFDYLCSYSGLETLELCSMSFDSVEDSNTSAQTFYKSVLPQLVHSLQVLKIQPKQEGRWCFNPEDDFQSVALFQCNKLRSLSVALNCTSFLRPIDFFYSSRDCVIHQFKDNLGDAISSLINLSLSLPALSEICIVIPELGLESNVVILGVADMTMFFYREIVIGLVTRSITGFSLHAGHSTTDTHIGQLLLPDIWIDGKTLYQYRTTLEMDEGERQRYTLTYDKPLDPYEFVEDFSPIVKYIVPLDPS